MSDHVAQMKAEFYNNDDDCCCPVMHVECLAIELH